MNLEKARKTQIYAFGDPHLPINEYHSRYNVPLDYFSTLTAHLKTINPDLLLIAGDLSWGSNIDHAKIDLLMLKDLPGKYKIFIEGNHDTWFDSLGSTHEKAQKRAYHLFDDACFYYIGGRAKIIELENGIRIGICGTRGWELSNENNQDQENNLVQSLDTLKELLKNTTTNVNICLLHYPPINYFDDNSSKINTKLMEIIDSYNFINNILYGHVHLEANHPTHLTINNIECFQVTLSKASYRATEVFIVTPS